MTSYTHLVCQSPQSQRNGLANLATAIESQEQGE